MTHLALREGTDTDEPETGRDENAGDAEYRADRTAAG